jgi:hypothetical protein
LLSDSGTAIVFYFKKSDMFACSIVLFWQEENVLYQLHIRFQEDNQEEVHKIMLDWMEKFWLWN